MKDADKRWFEKQNEKSITPPRRKSTQVAEEIAKKRHQEWLDKEREGGDK